MLRAALGGDADFGGPFGRLRPLHRLFEHQRMADDDRQRIVQFMRDAGQQRSQRRHFLALVQSFALALNFGGRRPRRGHVAQMRREHSAASQANFGDGEFDRKYLAVRPHCFDFDAAAEELRLPVSR